MSRVFHRTLPEEQCWEASILHRPEWAVKWTLLNVISTFKKNKRLLLRQGINCITRQRVGVEGKAYVTARGKIKEFGMALQTSVWTGAVTGTERNGRM